MFHESSYLAMDDEMFPSFDRDNSIKPSPIETSEDEDNSLFTREFISTLSIFNKTMQPHDEQNSALLSEINKYIDLEKTVDLAARKEKIELAKAHDDRL